MNDFEPRQIFIAHEVIWNAMVNWAAERDLSLLQIPETDDLPTYMFSPNNLKSPR